MKNLEQTQVEQLLEIIQSKPGQRIVHFSKFQNIIGETLELGSTIQNDALGL